MFLCFLSFCGLSSPDCIGFGVYWSVCFRFFFWLSSPQFPKTPGRNIQPTDPGGTVPQKTLEGLSSPHFPKNCRDYPVHTPPKKSWKDYPVHSSQKNPGGTIQSTVPKKTLQGLSSPHFPKKPCRDYPVHTSQKKSWRDYPVHTSPKKPWRDYPVHTSQKKSWRNYPVHSFQKKILMLFHHLQA